MQMKTMSGEYDPAVYASVSERLRRAGAASAPFTASTEKFVRVVTAASMAMMMWLKAYYESFEAELRWEDEGGACYDRGE